MENDILSSESAGRLEIFFWILLAVVGGSALASLIFLYKRSRARESRIADRLGEASDTRDYAEALIENTPEGFIVLDEQFTIVQVNEAYCGMTGRSREELVGRCPPFPGWAPEEQEMLEERGRRILRGDYEPFEVSYVKTTGERFLASFNPGIVRTKQGKRYFIAVVKDVTEQKRTEEKLREDEAMFRRIADTSTDAIYQIDLDGMIVYVSPAVERILGYSQGEFVGTLFSSHFLPEDLPLAEDAFVRNIRGEELRNIELRILNKDKKPIPIGLNATPIREDGKIIGSQGVARDITERKKAEALLRASEAHLRTVLESVPFDLLFIDKSGRYVMQNTASKKAWGDVTGKRPEEVTTDAETLALWRDNNRRAFSGEAVRGEVNYSVLGKERFLYNIVSPVYSGDGIRGILIVNVDITERKLAENALKESEERYRFLVENTGTAVSFWDTEGKLLLANRIAAHYLGSTPEQMIGKKVHDFLPKDQADRVRARQQQVLRSGVGMENEEHLNTPTGKRWFRSFLQPVKDVGGRYFGVQIVSHDVTELMRAERALRESDARLRLMVSQLPAVLWTVDSDLRYTSSAGAGLATLKIAPSQVVGMTLYEFFNTNDPEFLPIAKHRRSLEGEAANYEMNWENRIWETHTEPLRDQEEKIVGCLGIALDVTERKLAEEEVRQSREQLRSLTERLHAVREEEGASIAREVHDELGQALTGLKFDLDFIRRRLGRCEELEERAKLDEKIKEMCETIDTEISVVRKISTRLRTKALDDLGLIGAIEMYTQEFRRRTGMPCDVNQYGAEGMESDMDSQRKTAIFRILQEILTNVRRHAEATRVWVDLRVEGESFILEVRDNGKGIPPDRLKHLDGLGVLGMRERAHVFGGHVEIDSESGKGTSVSVTIPVGKSS